MAGRVAWAAPGIGGRRPKHREEASPVKRGCPDQRRTLGARAALGGISRQIRSAPVLPETAGLHLPRRHATLSAMTAPPIRSPEPDPPLPVTVEHVRGWIVLRPLEASLMNLDVIESLGQQVESAVAGATQGASGRIVLDFSHVRYISSSMVGVLVGARQQVDAAGGRLVLCGLNDRLRELLRITRLHRMFTVVPTLHDAVDRGD